MIREFMKNGVKCFEVQAYGKRRTGQQVRRRRILRGVKRATAVKLEKRLIEELAALQQGFSFAGMTYQEFLKFEFYPHLFENYETQYDASKSFLNKWATPIMQLSLESINPTDIRKILETSGEELKNASVDRLKSLLKGSFDLAVQGGLKSNPVTAVKMKKNDSETEPLVLTREEVKILLAQSKILKPYYHKIWALSLFLGTRISELIACQRADVDLDRKIVNINKSYSKHLKGPNKIKRPKNGKSRNVPIADAILPMIRELMVGPKNEPLIKANYVLLKGDQSRVLKEFCREIGITPVTQHALRATFVTQMFASGATIAQVQVTVGHSRLDTTQIYLRHSGVDVMGVTNCLDFAMPPEKESKVVNLF